MSRARDLADSADKDIAGTLAVDGMTVDGNVTFTAGDRVIGNGDEKIKFDSTNQDIEFQTADSVRMLIDSNGEVTIGSGTAVKTLNVYGNDGSPLLLQGSGNDTAILFSHSNVVNGAINSSSDGAIEFRVGGSSAIDEAMRIDSSGNLLVGKTGPSFGTDGIEIRSDDSLYVTRSDTTAFFNRKTTDGDIVKFYKDSSTVGSIGTTGGDLTIYSSPASHIGLRFAQGTIFPTDNTGTNSDANIDFGYTTNRFKDLYLSGGVYLGGTGAANYLDDYEEGTWSPGISGGTISGGTKHGSYVKVGNLVTVCLFFNNRTIAGATGVAQITNLPFTVASGNDFRASGVLAFNNGTTATAHQCFANDNSTYVVLYKTTNTSASTASYANKSGVFLSMTITYRTT